MKDVPFSAMDAVSLLIVWKVKVKLRNHGAIREKHAVTTVWHGGGVRCTNCCCCGWLSVCQATSTICRSEYI